MKIKALYSAVAAVLLGGAALVYAAEAPKTPPTTPPAAPKPADAKPVNKFCAVEGKGHEVDPKVTVVFKGKTIGFCCRDCIEEFNKNPEKYVKGME